MKYRQLNILDRSALAALRSLGLSFEEIGKLLHRHRTTLWREAKRNVSIYDGYYPSQPGK